MPPVEAQVIEPVLAELSLCSYSPLEGEGLGEGISVEGELVWKAMYNPIDTAKEIKEKVVDGERRRYYRISRPGMWYGGIATADCCGCNLKCIFCWSNFPRDNPDKCGRFFAPEEIFYSLISCARRKGYQQLRISGNEVTIAKEHLLKLLKLVEKTDFRFIIETNGTLIDNDYAKELSGFKNAYVRISFKGTNPEEFSMLTGANPEGFNLQLKAVENLLRYGVNSWASVVVSFSPRGNLNNFRKTIKEISSKAASEIEEETIFLLPHIKKRLSEAGIKLITYEDIDSAKAKE